MPLHQLQPLYDFVSQHPFQALFAYLICRGPQRLLDQLKLAVAAGYQFCGFCYQNHCDFIADCEDRRQSSRIGHQELGKAAIKSDPTMKPKHSNPRERIG